MELHQFSDTIQDLCHEGHSLAKVRFGIEDIPYVLKAIDVTNGTVTFRLQAEPQNAVHEGFLALGQKSSKSEEKS